MMLEFKEKLLSANSFQKCNNCWQWSQDNRVYIKLLNSLKYQNIRWENHKTKSENSAGGILGKPTYKSRNKLPQSTLEAVAAFCKNDDYTRVMPGKSDCVMLQETCKSKND